MDEAANTQDTTSDVDRDALLAPYTLNPVQWAFVACESRFSFYVGGVGAGKTHAGAVRAILRALDFPGALGLIGAPT